MTNKQFTTNLCTFMGREYNIKILLPYIEKALEIEAIDRYYMIDMTRKISDHNLIHSEQKRLNDKFPGRVFIVNGDNQKKLLQSEAKLEGGSWAPFYSFLNTFSDNDVIIKCDDDTMFIDVESLKAAAQLRWENKSPFLMHANCINNGICGYHQHKKNIWKFKGEGMDMYPAAGLTGPLFADLGKNAYNCHKQFSNDLSKNPLNIENYKLKENIYFSHRVSINFIFMLGSDRKELSKIDKQDEYVTSGKLPQKLDRPNMIIGDCVVSHHSYGRQEEYLESKNSIQLYSNLVDSYFTKKTLFENKPITNLHSKCSAIKSNDKYLFGSWTKDEFAIKNIVEDKYLCVTSEKRERFLFKIKGDPSTKYGSGEFFLKEMFSLESKIKTTFKYKEKNIQNKSDILKACDDKGRDRYNAFLTNKFFFAAYKANQITFENFDGGSRIKDSEGRYLLCQVRKDGTCNIFFQKLPPNEVESKANIWSIEKLDHLKEKTFCMEVKRENLDEVENDPTFALNLNKDFPDMYNVRGYYWTIKNHLWKFIPNDDGFEIELNDDEGKSNYLSSKGESIVLSASPQTWIIKNNKIIHPKSKLEVTLSGSPSLSKNGTKMNLHL